MAQCIICGKETNQTRVMKIGGFVRSGIPLCGPVCVKECERRNSK